MTQHALWSLRSRRLVNHAARANKRLLVIASSTAQRCPQPRNCIKSCRCFAQVKDIGHNGRDIWFTSTAPRTSSLEPTSGEERVDERTLQLGKTIRTLHERLPTLLKEPLPSEVLSPQISLHLFPSTHPHLPTVSGRIAYIAALWTAPVAWGRIPLIGNVELSILSERMVRRGGANVSKEQRQEQLVVKWKTCGKTTHRDGTGGIYRGMGIGARDPVDRIKAFIAGTKGELASDASPEEFCGIFIFEFDESGRIVKHIIEHTEEGGHFDQMTRVVSVTDWLIGTFNGKRAQQPALAWCTRKPEDNGLRFRGKHDRN